MVPCDQPGLAMPVFCDLDELGWNGEFRPSRRYARTLSHALWTTGKETWTMARRGYLIALLLTGLFGWVGSPTHGQALRPGQLAADLTRGPWSNSPALSMEGLRGRVVLLEFWTYG